MTSSSSTCTSLPSIAPRVALMPYFVIAIGHLVSSLPGLSPVYLLLSVAGFIFWTKKQRDELVLLLLLLGSSFSYTSLNIWNNGIIPALPFLLLSASFLVTNVRAPLSGVAVGAVAFVALLGISLGNIFEVGLSPFIVDLLIVASIPLAALRFKRLTERQFFLAFSACALITLLKVVLFAFAGIENPLLSANTDATFLDTLDELTGFYLLTALVLISSRNRLQLPTLLLFGTLIVHYLISDNWLGYYGIGSQVLLALIIFVLFLLSRFPVALLAFVAFLSFVIPLLSLYAEDSGDLKLLQLVSVADILTGADINLLPHSVHVRVAEMTAFFGGEWHRVVTGGGLGGYVNLTDDFPDYLGPDDYSAWQIESGKITTPHNLGYLLVKFGLLGVGLATYLMIKIHVVAKKMSAFRFAFYMTFAAFLILNLGYTLKISFLLGVLWVAVRSTGSRMPAS